MNDDETKHLLDGPAEDVKTRIAGKSHDDLLKIREAEQAGQNRADVLLVIEADLATADAARAGGVVQMEPVDAARAMMDDTHRPAALDTSGEAAVAPATTVSAPLTNHHTVAADLDGSGPADIDAASSFSPSGAPRQVTDFDPGHPAVDNNPRAGTTVEMNKIDFNDPTKTGAEIAAEQLAKA